jgi:hypothetical protein
MDDDDDDFLVLAAGNDVVNRDHSLMSKLVKTAFRTASTELAGAFA